MVIRCNFNPLGKKKKHAYTFTINPTPSNATVVLTASGFTQVGNSITVEYGTTVRWSVSASHYTTKTGTYTVTAPYTMPVSLVQVEYTLTINPNPSDATVKITLVGGSTTTGKTRKLHYGDKYTYSISKTDYMTRNSSQATMTGNKTITTGINPNTLISITSGSKTVSINAAAKFNVTCVGGGGGGATTVSNGTYSNLASGGSGACWIGTINLPIGSCVGTCGSGGGAANTTMTNATAGNGGNSTIKVTPSGGSAITYVTCKGGTGGKATSVSVTKGSGADTPALSGTYSSTTRKAGNDGKQLMAGSGTVTAKIAGGAGVNPNATSQGAGGAAECYLGSYTDSHKAVAGNNGRLLITMNAYTD